MASEDLRHEGPSTSASASGEDVGESAGRAELLLAALPDGTLPDGLELSSVPKKLVAYVLDGLLVAGTCGVGWLVWAASVAGGGQTPARWILGMRVVSTRDGQPLSWSRMVFGRGLLGTVVALLAYAVTLGGLVLLPLWDPRNQTVCDKVSSSVVLDDPNRVYD